jgi:hypothetical protein
MVAAPWNARYPRCQHHGGQRFYVLGVDPGGAPGAALIKVDPSSRTGQEPSSILLGWWQLRGSKMTHNAFALDVLRKAKVKALTSCALDPDSHAIAPLWLCHEAQFQGPATQDSFGVSVRSGIWRGLAWHYAYRVLDSKGRFGVHPSTWHAWADDRPKGQRHRRSAKEWDAWALQLFEAETGLDLPGNHCHVAESWQIARWAGAQLSAALHSGEDLFALDGREVHIV